jgi:H+/Cl- antiporter ClcA
LSGMPTPGSRSGNVGRAGAVALSVLPFVLRLRFGLGAVSYAARTPGGLFAPMLVLGAQLGLLFGTLCRLAHPGLAAPPEAFAVVGMAAFFTGVVRAPVTGIVLIIEMTAAFTMFLPMLGACFVAMLVPTPMGARGTSKTIVKVESSPVSFTRDYRQIPTEPSTGNLFVVPFFLDVAALAGGKYPRIPAAGDRFRQ